MLRIFIITLDLYPNTEWCTKAYQQNTKKASLVNRENNIMSKTRNIIPSIYLLQVNKSKDITQ
jgi:hypothetical protein